MQGVERNRYARENLGKYFKNTSFIKGNYLDMDFQDSFDIVTLIFYDFCALYDNEQKKLLVKIHAALKDNGMLIFDVVTENRKVPIVNNLAVHDEGFWSPDPYIEIMNTFLYDDPKTEGNQYAIIDENGAMRVIMICHRLFGLQEITDMLRAQCFMAGEIYQNLKGDSLQKNIETFGIFAGKI